MLKTAEYVSIGHPDKVADFISSYLLDTLIQQDPTLKYAVEVMIKDNTVILGDEELLFTKKVRVKDVSFISGEDITEPIKAQVKLRYSMQPQPAVITKADGGVMVEFTAPQRAATPGQAAVFYSGDIVLGGGIIEKGEN